MNDSSVSRLASQQGGVGGGEQALQSDTRLQDQKVARSRKEIVVRGRARTISFLLSATRRSSIAAAGAPEQPQFAPLKGADIEALYFSQSSRRV